jgi:hypothetical protein
MKSRENGFVDSVSPSLDTAGPRQHVAAEHLTTRPEAEAHAENVQTDEEHNAAHAEYGLGSTPPEKESIG